MVGGHVVGGPSTRFNMCTSFCCCLNHSSTPFCGLVFPLLQRGAFSFSCMLCYQFLGCGSHFILFLFFFGEGAVIISPSPFFWECWALPNRRIMSLDPKWQNNNTCAPLFSLYTWELNFGQIIWDKIELVLGTSWGIS